MGSNPTPTAKYLLIQTTDVMPTPMRKLLNWMEENPFNLDIPVECVDMVKILCEEEKIELIKAREDGIYTMINGTVQEKQITSEEYYNKLNEEKN